MLAAKIIVIIEACGYALVNDYQSCFTLGLQSDCMDTNAVLSADLGNGLIGLTR